MNEHSHATDMLQGRDGLVCSLYDADGRPSPAAKKAVSRRKVLKMGAGALGALALVEVGGASLLYLQSNAAQDSVGGLVTAGAMEDFPPGSVTEFPNARFFLIRTSEGGFMAVHSRCTHLGCTVYWEPEENKFFCPCHAATFDALGVHQGPPVPRPLDLFEVTFKDGEVRVDTSRSLRREGFDSVQLVHS